MAHRAQPVTTARAPAAYVAMSTIDALGSGMFLPVATLSLTVLMGVPVAYAGLTVTAGTVAGLLVGLGAGHVLQWLRAGHVLVGSLLVRAAAMFGYTALHGVVAGTVVTATGRIGSTIGRPASTALAAQMVVEDQQVPLLARSHAWRNVAFGAGAAVVALLLAVLGSSAYVVLIVANAVSYLVAAGLARYLTRSATGRRATVESRADPPTRVRMRDAMGDRVFLRVIASIAVLSTQSALLTVALPLWLLSQVEAARAGVLAAGAIVLNTVLVALLQVRLSRGARDPAKAVRLLRWSGALFVAGCLAPLLSSAGVSLWLTLVVMTTLLTAAEILVSAGSWGAALGFAPPTRPELHIAVASWAQGLGEALAAGTVGTLAAAYGDVGWVATAAIFMLPVLALPGRPLVPLILGRRPT